MVAVGSTCAAAWPRRRAATLAVMTFNGPNKERVEAPAGEGSGSALALCDLLFSGDEGGGGVLGFGSALGGWVALNRRKRLCGGVFVSFPLHLRIL
jgi:hypothetical protein